MQRHALKWIDIETGDTVTIGDPGIDGGGVGATFHRGQIWATNGDSAGEKNLVTIDVLTGESAETGLTLPSEAIDAIASRAE